MSSNEIGSQYFGSLHTVNILADSTSFDTFFNTKECKQVAKTSSGDPIVMAEDNNENAPQPLTSMTINSPKKADVKKKKNSTSLEKKFEIIMYKDANPTVSWRQLGAKFGLPKSTVKGFCKPRKRNEIIEAMKNPQMAKMLRCSKSVKWHKKQLEKNLPLADSKLKQLEEHEKKMMQKKQSELDDKPRTCIRTHRTRLTLSDKLKFIEQWEEEKTRNPEISITRFAKMLGLDGATLRSMVLISEKIKRALLIPETADMISIPREKLLRKMFDDAGLEFPPLPEKPPEPDGPPDFLFTLSAGDISEVITTTLNHCEFDQVEHTRFVLNLRELVQSKNEITLPNELPKFIPKPIEVDYPDDEIALENTLKSSQELLDDDDEFESE